VCVCVCVWCCVVLCCVVLCCVVLCCVVLCCVVLCCVVLSWVELSWVELCCVVLCCVVLCCGVCVCVCVCVCVWCVCVWYLQFNVYSHSVILDGFNVCVCMCVCVCVCVCVCGVWFCFDCIYFPQLFALKSHLCTHVHIIICSYLWTVYIYWSTQHSNPAQLSQGFRLVFLKVKVSHNLCGRRRVRHHRPPLLQGPAYWGQHRPSLLPRCFTFPDPNEGRYPFTAGWTGGTVLKPKRANGHPSNW